MIRKMNKKSPARMRRKLRRFRQWMNEGRFTVEDADTAYQSWRGHMLRGNSAKVLRKTDALYRELFENGEVA